MKNVFIIGSKGYTKNYGGWETFVHGLIDNWNDNSVHFYVFEFSNDKSENGIIRSINNIQTISIYVKQTGNIAMVLYDLYSTKFAYKYVKENKIENPIFFFLGNRIGPYVKLVNRKFRKQGIKIIENPAGLEWKRAKWNGLVKLYVKHASKSLASIVDCLVCDNGGVKDVYDTFRCCKKVKKIVIPYGTYPRTALNDILPTNVSDYYQRIGIEPGKFFLILGRLVPENNYDLMLSEISKYKGNNKFLVICNSTKENKYFSKLDKKYHLEDNKHIIFAGEMYDKDILSFIRQNAIAYIHGHSVGGTNPGLLEAMSNTNVNVLFDCAFNREVGKECAFYFTSNQNSLLDTILIIERMNKNEILQMGQAAIKNMADNYSWGGVCELYSNLFNQIVN